VEKRGWVDSSWGVTENNRKARYYQITTAGKRHLKRETDLLLRYNAAVSGILTETA
jgi:DNA-binding PadR family transcriptional regulator